MLRLTEIKLPLDHPEGALKAAILERLGIPAEDLVAYTIARRGHDARKPEAILFVYTLDVEVKNEPAILKRLKNDRHLSLTPDTSYHFVAQAPANLASRPVVIGTGPAGLFAGLILAQMGFRPIILERGKAVRERTKDTFGLWRKGKLDPESNVQFGEGGAGTFSDGKLHSQIKDPQHHGRKVLTEFVKAGAPPEILYVSKPHIGTFRLVGMVEKMRATIEALGGEIRFQSRVDDLEIDNGQVRGVVLASGERIASRPCRAGGRPQRARHLRDAPRARRLYRSQALFHRLSHRASAVADRPLPLRQATPATRCWAPPITSWCTTAATAVRSTASACARAARWWRPHRKPGRVVTNGMSQYSRNERNANSGIVVGITPDDYPGRSAGRHRISAPLGRTRLRAGRQQLLGAGATGRRFSGRAPSTAFGSVQPSYTPGVHLCDLSTALPDYVIAAIREAIPAFDKQIKGFAMHDAVLTGVETRTSSPIRIKRNDDYQSLNTRGLYPAGEGAGYAGGILSAAVDGIKVAEAVALSMVESAKREA